MWTAFGIILLLLGAYFCFLRNAFALPFLSSHPFWWFGSFLGIFLLFQIWFWLRPAPVPLTANETTALREAVRDAIEKVESVEGALPATVAVVHFASDPTDDATRILRGELADRDGWTIVSGSPAVSFLKSIGKTLNEATSVDEYLRPGRRVGIDVLFYGTVRSVASYDGISRATLTVKAYDTRTGKNLFADDVAASYPKVRTAVGRSIVATPRSRRWWIFAAIALVLPWALAPFTLGILGRRSNGSNAGVLATLVGLDLLAGAILFYGISGHALAAVGVVLLCVLYDLVCCEVLSRRATVR